MSTLQHFGKGVVRVAKNYTKGYSDVQAKVRDATSNDPWGPSGTQMNELAQLTYNQNDFVEIMEMLDKRLNDKGKNWRHVFKSLTVLDYLLHAGSENVVIYFRDNLYLIKTLKEFQFIDEIGKDQGANVRQKAKDITNLLMDEARLRQERRSRANMRDRMTSGSRRSTDFEEGDNENDRRRSQSAPPRKGNPREDDDLRKAIEESKRSLVEEQARKGTLTAEERDLLHAIKLSEEEERKRNEAVDKANERALFDENNQLINMTPTSINPFPLVDTGLQAQNTSAFMQPQFTAVPTQYTSFNPYQQQAQQEALQAEYQRQQQEWMLQQQQQQQQQHLLAQQQQQQQHQQQEEWYRQQQLLQFQQQQQQQQPLVPGITGFGTNNPFAPATSPPPMSSASPPLSAPQPSVQFNLGGTYSNGTPPSFSSSVSPQPPQPQQSLSAPPSAAPGSRGPSRTDQEHSQLANLFAQRTDDGVDSFGNVGPLRFGGQAGQVTGQPTGANHNPFYQQQQQQQQQQYGAQNSDQPFFSV
ncbi:uncharacterized protein PHACADRAFT_263382 [Phanerochaete carnosa HHB-10118-sp]|uniref:ENTH domain-containing protein n=1 Tax=Phanerochaete carnosa (strain HHB-10118-sp) TaxID=650164 RepID=K5VJ60_PHACS|nr:uncharacterized protein PHACADRAFT_263382 [Phanerochaete carnosa HHB-10118-sp]EKM51338.1 hypothetical protein PHACADRAFT_263382 [Phanerochaete carnosa HHB-10118-sp]